MDSAPVEHELHDLKHKLLIYSLPPLVPEADGVSDQQSGAHVSVVTDCMAPYLLAGCGMIQVLKNFLLPVPGDIQSDTMSKQKI